MPANRAAFPKGKRREVWEYVIAGLKADAVLKRSVQTFQVLDGRDKDPLKEWTFGMLPALAVSMTGRGGEWAALRDHKAPLVFTFSLAIDSTAFPDLLDMWESVEDALFPTTAPHGPVSALRSAGVQGCTIVGPAVEPSLICDDKALATTGQILFNFHRYT